MSARLWRAFVDAKPTTNVARRPPAAPRGLPRGAVVGAVIYPRVHLGRRCAVPGAGSVSPSAAAEPASSRAKPHVGQSSDVVMARRWNIRQ